MQDNRNGESDALAIVLQGLERSLEILPTESVWRGCLLEFRRVLRRELDDYGAMTGLVDGES
jgi:hypothetical protein